MDLRSGGPVGHMIFLLYSHSPPAPFYIPIGRHMQACTYLAMVLIGIRSKIRINRDEMRVARSRVVVAVPFPARIKALSATVVNEAQLRADS